MILWGVTIVNAGGDEAVDQNGGGAGVREGRKPFAKHGVMFAF